MVIEVTSSDLQPEAGFIGSVYRASLEPQAYDDLMNSWDNILSNLLAAASEAPEIDAIEKQLSSLKPHFDRGLEALDRVGRHPSAANLMDIDPRAALGLTVDGTVTYSNEIAQIMFGGSMPESIPALLDEVASTQLLDRLTDYQAGNTSHPEPLILIFKPTKEASASADGRLMALLPLQDGTLTTDGTIGRLIAVELAWNDAAGHWVRTAFNLTTAEVEVLRNLVDGGSLQTFAKETGKSIETVRSQLKSIQRKTDTRSQTELVRLFMGFNHVPPEQNATLGSKRVRTVASHFIQLPDGRQLQFDEFGSSSGRPVVFLHGMLDGTEPPPVTQQVLAAHNIRLICPWRAGFAESSALDCPDEARPDQYADDLCFLMKNLAISCCPLIGHLSGSLFAFAAAAKHPDNFSALISVGGAVPIVSDVQISLMSRRQRIIALSGKYTPRLLPFILRAALAQIDAGGVDKLVNAMYETSSADGQIVADPVYANAVYQGYRASVAQGYSGFQQDGVQVLKDWSAFMHGTLIPVTLIHGEEDPTVRLSTVKDTLTRHPTFNLQVLPGVGQLVWYAAPERVIAAILPYLDNQ